MASNEAVSFYGPSAPRFRRKVLAFADPPYRFLSPHQAAVLDAATHRLVPGRDDDPVGLGHRGAGEARVVTYVDRLLLRCVANLRDKYINGIALLDRQAGGDFTSLPPLRQDFILSHRRLASFTSLLFGHTIDAMYAAPEFSTRDHR